MEDFAKILKRIFPFDLLNFKNTVMAYSLLVISLILILSTQIYVFIIMISSFLLLFIMQYKELISKEHYGAILRILVIVWLSVSYILPYFKVDISPLILLVALTFVPRQLYSSIIEKIKKFRLKYVLVIVLFILLLVPHAETVRLFMNKPSSKEVCNEIVIDPISMSNATIKWMLDKLGNDVPGSWIKLREIRWDLIEPNKGEINYTVLNWYKYWVNYAKSRNLKVMLMIVSTTGVSIMNKRLGIPDWVPYEYSDEGIDEYVRFVKWIVKEFPDINHWQIGNEMDLVVAHRGFSIFPKSVDWYIHVAEAVKEANPNAKVYVNLVYGLPYYFDLVEAIAKYAPVDYIGPDLYFGSGLIGYAEDFWKAIERTYNVIKKYGKKVWAAEIGYPTGDIFHDEETQVQVLKDIFAVLQRSHATMINYCRVFEQPDNLYGVDTIAQPTGRWDHGLALITNEGKPKKAYDVYARAAKGEIFELSINVYLSCILGTILSAISVVNSIGYFYGNPVYVILAFCLFKLILFLLALICKRIAYLLTAIVGISLLLYMLIGGFIFFELYYVLILNVIEWGMILYPLAIFGKFTNS